MHGSLGVGHRLPGLSDASARRAHVFGDFQFGANVVESRVDRAQRVVGLDSRGGFVVGRQFGGVLRSLAAVDRVVEGEAIVALSDGVVGLLQQILRGRELVARIAIRAGGARRVDGALGLLHLPVGRFGAAGHEGRERGAGGEGEATEGRHFVSIRPSPVSIGCSTMKELSPNDRPREKLLRHGAQALGDNELVALVLGSGCRRRGALLVANELLGERGGLHGLVQATCGDLARVCGIGQARAAQLVAAVELGRRTLTETPRARLQLRTPHQSAAFLMPAFGARGVEQFGIVLLDTRHRVIRTAVLAVGSLNATGVEPREVFREAALAGAAAVIVFHNHPSGDPTPSPDDVELTRRLVAAGVLMGIDVVDHIILGDVRYCSFKEMGHL